MADSQIVSSAVADAQSVYQLQGGVRFILKAVNADFADNGAASAWLPAVVIGSDSGNVIARAVDQAVQVAAGSDAACSFFPGVKHASGGGAVGVDLPWMYAEGNMKMVDSACTYFDFVQSADGIFGTPLGGSNLVKLLAIGLYEVTINSEWTTTSGVPAVGSRVRMGYNVSYNGSTGSDRDVLTNEVTDGELDQSGVAGHFVWKTHGIFLVNVRTFVAAPTIALSASCSIASSLNSADTTMYIKRISSVPLAGDL